MAILDKINVGGLDYDIVDAQARADIEELKESQGGSVDAYTKEEADKKFALADKVPTAQSNSSGDNSKYIWAQGSGSNDLYNVLSSVKFKSDADTYTLQTTMWGGVNLYSSSTGVISGATTSKAGLMTSKDKTKLDNINVEELQPTLVSGSNIKTINGESILGDGDLKIEGGGSVDAYTKAETDDLLKKKQDKMLLSTLVRNVEDGYNNYGVTFSIGDYALVGPDTPYPYTYNLNFATIEGHRIWSSTEAGFGFTFATINGEKIYVDSRESYTRPEFEFPTLSDFNSAIASKQDMLESGTNIKTINGESILGEGNIEIQGGGGGAELPSGNYFSKLIVDNHYEPKGNKYNSYITFTEPSFDGGEMNSDKIDFATINGEYIMYSGSSGSLDLKLATKDELNTKQDKMTNNYLSKVDVGGSSISIETKAFADESVQKTDTINFKTINGNPIFGMGDIKIDGGDTSNLVTKDEFNSTVGNIETLLSQI